MLSGRRLGCGNKVEGVLEFGYREKAQPRDIYICVYLLVCWQLGGSEWTAIVADVI